MSDPSLLRYVSYVLVALALFAFLGSNFERPAVVSIDRSKVNYIGGHVLSWDSTRNLLILDGEIADQAAVLGVAGNRVIVRLRSIGPTFAAFPIFGTGKSFVTLDGGASVFYSSSSSRAGQTLHLGTEVSGLPSSGQVTVSWVLGVPGSSALTSSEVRPLPFSGRIDSPTKTILIGGTYSLSTTIAISEFELGENLYSAPDLQINVLTTTTTATSTASNDTKPPLVSCSPSTFDPVPRTTPLLFKCTIYDASGIAGAYAKVNGATTTAQFLYDNSSGQWTYLVPASSYVIGETVGTLSIVAIDSSSNANSATTDFPFLVMSDGKPSASGNLNGSRIGIPLATDEPLLNIKTPVPAVSPAPVTPLAQGTSPQVKISKGLAPLLKVLGIPLWVLLAVLAVITYAVSGQRNNGKRRAKQ